VSDQQSRDGSEHDRRGERHAGRGERPAEDRDGRAQKPAGEPSARDARAEQPADQQAKGGEQPDRPAEQLAKRSGGGRGGRGGRGQRGRRGDDRNRRGEQQRGEQRGEPRTGREGGGREGGGRGGQRNDMTLVVFLARAGAGSRRRCDELIREGKVTIDGAVVTFPREKVGEQAAVALEGEVVTPREYRYVLVNKPRGVASTRSDPHAERVIVDMVPDGRTLFPVGRLDLETTGLIILTNDGPLANRLMHPRYGVTKTYSARVRGQASKRALAELRAGVELEDGRTAPAEARIEKQSNKTALVELTIHEGRKHQVRRMLAALDLPVEELHRRRYGPLSDKNLKIGAWRLLSGDEVEALRRAGEEVERNVAGDDAGEAVELAAQGSEPGPIHRDDQALDDAIAAALARGLEPRRDAVPPEPEGDEAPLKVDDVMTRADMPEPSDEATPLSAEAPGRSEQALDAPEEAAPEQAAPEEPAPEVDDAPPPATPPA
jgi:23S rRNA pseudouridine2605 synthase